MVDYEIIATGSKGNALVLNNSILIDLGVPWKAIKGVSHKLQLVILTHKHGDHFNRSTIRRLAQERPTVRWCVPEWLVERLLACEVKKRNIDVMEMDKRVSYSFFLSVCPQKTTHNVENCCWHIFIHDNEKGAPVSVFYATDTNSLDRIEAKGYDLYFVEANYTESEITERIRRKQENDEFVHEWEVLKNHLSKESAEDWLYKNMAQHSQYVLLHQHED
ncbi:MAG: MBL fold metallo-hydrolase [Oscillospiraceae bacterium]|nr:MBL fold metallo-hydrolase [Oscillospiraceae bacterium]MCL2278130.1 MBL fold metallo-hydrolase [Oscillospiraceae bacterium]